MNEYCKEGALKGHFDGGRWIYDFSVLLKKQIQNADISIEKSSFTGGDWDKYGYLIKIKL